MLEVFLVGVPGFEPGKAGPESAVLPLHHTPKTLSAIDLLSNAGAKVVTFPQKTKFFLSFFSWQNIFMPI